MIDAVEEVKIRARILLKSARLRHFTALERLQKHVPRPLQSADLRLGLCLDVLSRELGFRGWQQGLRILRGEILEDHGQLLHKRGVSCFLNLWFANYREAKHEHRKRPDTYLIPYKRHCAIVSKEYIAHLGLDPNDSDWHTLEWDWLQPKRDAARNRLYSKLLAGLPREA